jgi:hypothetical protein
VILSVSTVKDSLPNVEKFVRRNLAGGVDHLVVCLDAEQPDVQDFLTAHPHVTCVATHRGWWHGRRPTRLNRRQNANANVVAQLVARLGWVDWLIHLDGDEVVDLDTEELGRLDPQARVVTLAPLEAVTGTPYGEDAVLFKRLLDGDELQLLYLLGLVVEPDNGAYFRGHVSGKRGLRPAADLQVGIHWVLDGDGSVIEPVSSDRQRVFHFESATFEEFERKWEALLTSGGVVTQRGSRAAVGSAIAALRATGLVSEEARPYLRRIYDRVADDVPTLLDLRLLERVDPDGRSRSPQPLPPGGREAMLHLLDRLRPLDKEQFAPSRRGRDLSAVMEQVDADA